MYNYVLVLYKIVVFPNFCDCFEAYYYIRWVYVGFFGLRLNLILFFFLFFLKKTHLRETRERESCINPSTFWLFAVSSVIMLILSTLSLLIAYISIQMFVIEMMSLFSGLFTLPWWFGLSVDNGFNLTRCGRLQCVCVWKYVLSEVNQNTQEVKMNTI